MADHPHFDAAAYEVAHCPRHTREAGYRAHHRLYRRWMLNYAIREAERVVRDHNAKERAWLGAPSATRWFLDE